MNDQSLLDEDYGLGAVVATIDAVNCLDTLDNHQEAVKQVGTADLLLLTKSDLFPKAGVRSARSACCD
jgi:G3E family GTPase